MKIVVLQDRLRSGGTERQSIWMTRAFQAAGHSVLLLTFRPGGALAPSASDLPHRALQPFDIGLDWFAPGLKRTVRHFDPDVVLCMGRMANCRAGGLQTALLGEKGYAAVIATMRTGKPLPWMFRHSLRLVMHTVANSEDARQVLLSQYGVPARRVSVIRNALVFPPRAEEVPGLPSQKDAAFRARFGASPNTCVLLWVGMFRPEKNQRSMIEIADSLPREMDWQLWFVGDGSAKGECEALVRELRLEDRVKFLGFVPDPTPFYGAADIAVLTSRSESLSNFLIEAHAHGLPSVAYSVRGVLECGGHVVPENNQEAFRDALVPLMRDSRVRQTEGERVAAFARTQFSPSNQANAYLDLFRTLTQKAAYEE